MFLDNNLLKSLTVTNCTVLSAIVKFSVSSSVVDIDCFISSVFAESTSFTKYVLSKPIATAIKEVTTNVIRIVTMILPILFGVFILAIDDVMVKNISGTIITNKRFRKMSPSG